MKKIDAYHYTDSTIKKFNLKHIGKGNDQFGPGIYFSAEPINGGTKLYKVELTPRKLITDRGGFTKKEIVTLMKNSPNLKDKLMDWSENPREAFQLLLDSIMDAEDKSEQFQVMWIDVYGVDFSREYLEELVKLGYDGELIEGSKHLSNKNKFYVIFNPKVIKIVSVEKRSLLESLLECDNGGLNG